MFNPERAEISVRYEALHAAQAKHPQQVIPLGSTSGVFMLFPPFKTVIEIYEPVHKKIYQIIFDNFVIICRSQLNFNDFSHFLTVDEHFSSQ